MQTSPVNTTGTSATKVAEQKLSAARTRLILDKPFLGTLVLRLPLVAADWCQTSGTDAKSLYYNRSYINDLSLSQVQFVLAHEALHCGLSHFARRDHRNRRRWDVACDHAVNQLLVADGLELPESALFNEDYNGMSAEEIYPCIAADDDKKPMDQHLYDSQNNGSDDFDYKPPPADQDDIQNNDQNPKPDTAKPEQHNCAGVESITQSPPHPKPLDSSERDKLDTQWQQRLAGAALQAAQSGKLSESLARMVERLLQPTVPWRTLLARYMSSAARIDYNLMRPSRRREGDAILPSLHTRQIDVAIAIDTSGSIKQEELDAFLTELNALKGSMNARVTLLACDAVLDDDCPWIYEPWDPMVLPASMSGGGTTDFNPVFEWLASNTMQPDLLIYFTDGKGHYPAQRPSIPVLWLLKGSTVVPWGQRIQLN